MARSDALLRLHESLVARRTVLTRRLGGELKDLLHRSGDAGDTADQAFESSGEEVSSQLAQVESRQLMQIEHSLNRLKQGTYGLCELCQKKIPVSRLNALPFSTTCIECQREMEASGEWFAGGVADWGRVSDVEARMREPRELDVSQLEMDFSK